MDKVSSTRIAILGATPIGSFLSAGLIALLFTEVLVVFSLLVLGFTTHFMSARSAAGATLSFTHFLSTERKRTKKEPFSGPEGKGRIKGAAVNLFARRRLRLRREYAKKRAEACVEG
jgi:hypothetical protein